MSLAPGRCAVVTGGASGIGREVAARLIGEGVQVALLDVDEERLSDAVATLGPNRALGVSADVRDPAAVRLAMARAEELLGGLDTLVLCAGVIHVKPLGEVTEGDWDLTLEVNLKGAFLCCQAAASALSSSGRGRIVMISSDAGRRGVPLLHAYSASKFGLIGLAESLAAELAPTVTVNAVCPVGIPSTAMGQRLLDWKVNRTGRTADQVLAGIARDLPLGRNCTERDIADAVLFLVSEGAGFITGVALDVDGGSHLNTMTGAE